MKAAVTLLVLHRVLLAELGGGGLLVAGLAVLWGAGAAMLGAAALILLKSLEWDLRRVGDR